MSATPEAPVVLGKVVEAYGLQGFLRIHPFGDDPAAWKRISLWWLREDRDGAPWQACKLEQCRLQGPYLLAKLAGVDDRSAAEARKGWLIGALRGDLPATAENEFYWADLIGLDVVNLQDERLGRVDGLIETGANAVLRVVDEAGAERLLPFVDGIVLAVESAAGRIRVDWGRDW